MPLSETAAAWPRGWPVGRELLDDPRADPRAVVAELHDIARLNRLFGGTRAVVEALEPLFTQTFSPRATGNVQRLWTLLDVGTGSGDIPLALVAAARRHGISLAPIGLDVIPAAARLARRNGVHAVVGDGSVPPFAPKSVDIVIASQVLHHLPTPVAVRWIAGLDRLARRAVVLADLYRSRLAMAGIWLAAGVLAMSRTTRHDAVVSLRRGYTRREFSALLDAAGVRGRVTRCRWARIVAVWAPSAIGRQLSAEPEGARLTADG
jgi:2-polyprenyl-3-methyl-5-hydroxy-6-metoxy-1,4-benzoquinol methylase